MSLEKAKEICRTLVDYYGNNSVDIQGGEPTLYPHIYELVAYCAEIGLVADHHHQRRRCSRTARSPSATARPGIRDFLVSVQALGPVYDQLVGRGGAHARADEGRCATCRRRASRSGSTRWCPRSAYRSFADIAELAVADRLPRS